MDLDLEQQKEVYKNALAMGEVLRARGALLEVCKWLGKGHFSEDEDLALESIKLAKKAHQAIDLVRRKHMSDESSREKVAQLRDVKASAKRLDKMLDKLGELIALLGSEALHTKRVTAMEAAGSTAPLNNNAMYCSVDQAEIITGLSRWTWRSWAYSGKIASHKMGARLLIPISELNRVIAEGYRPRVEEAKKNKSMTAQAEDKVLPDLENTLTQFRQRA